MQYKFLRKENNKNLIVFFSGWGSIEPELPAPGGFDVIMFHNYTDLSPSKIPAPLSGGCRYEKKHLIAWSLGVYVCNYYYEQFKDFDGFTAVNGTLKPIDNEYGIPKTAYNMTTDNFNELTCSKFMRKIGAPSDITRSIEDLKNELISIRDLEIKNFLPFKKAVISKKDRIFPYKNMLNFWSGTGAEIIEIDAPHYVFGSFKDWGSLI